MKIALTKEQYEALIKLTYLGNWMINAIRIDDRVKKYDDLEQYIYSFAKDAGLENYVTYDEKLKKYYPTRAFEEDTDVAQYMDEYDDEIFWNDLAERLADRDFIKKYGELTIHKMSVEERLAKLYSFVDKYEEEFEKHGLDNLALKR